MNYFHFDVARNVLIKDPGVQDTKNYKKIY